MEPALGWGIWVFPSSGSPAAVFPRCLVCRRRPRGALEEKPPAPSSSVGLVASCAHSTQVAAQPRGFSAFCGPHGPLPAVHDLRQSAEGSVFPGLAPMATPASTSHGATTPGHWLHPLCPPRVFSFPRIGAEAGPPRVALPGRTPRSGNSRNTMHTWVPDFQEH